VIDEGLERGEGGEGDVLWDRTRQLGAGQQQQLEGRGRTSSMTGMQMVRMDLQERERAERERRSIESAIASCSSAGRRYQGEPGPAGETGSEYMTWNGERAEGV